MHVPLPARTAGRYGYIQGRARGREDELLLSLEDRPAVDEQADARACPAADAPRLGQPEDGAGQVGAPERPHPPGRGIGTLRAVVGVLRGGPAAEPVRGEAA